MGLLESNGWIVWIVIGGIAGAIAKLLMPGKDPGGRIVTILLGIAGAFVAGFIGQSLGLSSASDGGRLHRRDHRRVPDPVCLPAGDETPLTAATLVHDRAIAAAPSAARWPFSCRQEK